VSASTTSTASTWRTPTAVRNRVPGRTRGRFQRRNATVISPAAMRSSTGRGKSIGGEAYVPVPDDSRRATRTHTVSRIALTTPIAVCWTGAST
jgi:hypothetical protein